MNKTAQTTKEKIVELGRDYMQRIGYHSFNYKQIADDLHIKNASIHHYFPTKEDLGLAVIEKDRQDFLVVEQRLRKAKPTEKLDALIEIYNNYFHGGQKLCVLSSFAACYNELTERMQLATSQYAELMASWLTEVFKEGLATGDFTFRQPVEEVVNQWMATLPGALLIGRNRGFAHYELVINGLKKALKS